MLCSLLTTFRDAAWFDRRRAVGYAGALLALEIVTFLFFVAGTHGLIVPLDKPTDTDFVSFYAAGSLADAGTPVLAYDRDAHYAAEQQAREPGIPYEYFYYPPVFILLCAALARLPYLVAFYAFEGATLLLYLWVARRVIGDRSWRVLVPLLAPPALFWTLGLGQNALLSAALFGAATLLIDSEPLAAGLLFGAICYKPHFGLLIPVALIAGGHWRAFAGAAAAVTGLTLLSLVLFGPHTWLEFFDVSRVSHSIYEGNHVDTGGFVSPFGAVLLLGGAPGLAYAFQAVATAVAAVLVAVVWWRRLSLPIRAAALLAAVPVAAPVILMYDSMIGVIAILWLMRDARARGFLPWEKTVLGAVFVAPVLSRALGDGWHVPLGPAASIALLALAFACARREMADRGSAGRYAAPRRSTSSSRGTGLPSQAA